MPGISGMRGERMRLVTARARRRLALTMPRTEGGVANEICVSPATTEVIAGEPPLNGTCTLWILATWLKCAAPKCGADPTPDVAQLSLPGTFFAAAMRSFTDLMPVV